jgi:pimeloyl-ACP methyl ester carboxylesterase
MCYPRHLFHLNIQGFYRHGLLLLRYCWSASFIWILGSASVSLAQQTIESSSVNSLLPIGASSRYATVNGVKLHYVIAGKGDPVVLLHGWPESWYAWRKVIPALAERYTVIAPDMRGYGDSERPASGYDKKTVAEDIYQLVRHLGYKKIHLVAQDMGGPVGYAYAAAHPDAVRRFVFMESALPGFGLETAMDITKGGSWHIGFNMARGIAETLVEGKERVYLEYFYRRGTLYPTSLNTTDIDEYVRTYKAGAMHAGFEYYRTLFDDAKQNQLYAQKKLEMPVLAIAADQGFKDFSRQSISQVASNVTAVTIKDAKHFVAQDQPHAVTQAIMMFLGGEKP